MAETNRRHFSRQKEEATIQVLLAAHDAKGGKDSLDVIPVKMGNQSREGLYFETDRVLEPGSNVSLKMVSPEGGYPEKAYYMRDGQVIWCKALGDKISRFGVGVKILRKVVQADVLTSRFR